MRPLPTLRLAAALCGAALALAALAAPARAFETGFDLAWIGQDYGSDFTSKWDPAATDLALGRAANAGASVVRLWLFEGEMKQGVAFDPNGTRAVGLVPGFLDHVETVCKSARRLGIKVYWTGLEGNWFWARSTRAANIDYNILQNKFGEQDAFHDAALGPVLDLLSRYPDTVFGYDVMNECVGSVSTWMWSDGWTGARRWIAAEAAFIHARAPGIAVTASAGWGSAADDLCGGRFSGLGLDFFDIHVYADSGQIPRALDLRMLSWRTGTRLVLGEFGQSSKSLDDKVQERATKAFLANARALGCVAALAWRLDDQRPSVPNYVPYLSFYGNGAPRPALADVRAFVAAHPNGRGSVEDYILGVVK